MTELNQQDFLKLTQQGNLIPVYKTISGDLETPVSAFFKLAHDAPYSFLLESVEGQEKIGRYSFIAKDPELIVTSKNDTAEVVFLSGKKKTRETHLIKDTPLTILRELMEKFEFVNIPELPRFCGGMVGYLSYDGVRFFERLPSKTKDDLKLPDMFFMMAKDLVIFDHLRHQIKVVSTVFVDRRAARSEKIRAYKEAQKKIDRLIRELRKPLTYKDKKPAKKTIKVRSNFTQAQFEKAVIEAKRQITAGEVIQVVLSQRFQADIHTHPFNIYRTLRMVNPSPYMFYLNLNGIKLVGSSPELLVRCENGVVETRPIAGTRKRGASEEEDEELKNELLADPKEKAEHIMLVDLGRNDLGRVCVQGTVKVTEFMEIERYSHVMHIVSNVQGRLQKDKDALDVLQAAFPAGTVSGAPKIRAMEILEDLESVRRGPYAGCIGYLSFSRNLDSCITIRTIVISGKTAYIQAGAGIVADSDPKSEYQETMNKARAQIRAIELAHNT